MTLDLMISKGMASAIVLLFFVGVVFFLRYLYGPGGRFRDPQWDVWNAEARREEAKKKDDRLYEWFVAYARGFFSGDAEADAPLLLKIEHSLRVLELARELVEAEPVFADPQRERALRLAALFHDVGRFEQFTRWGTFADALSCNHGLLGVRVIRQQGFFAHEKKELQRMALAAVASHNRLAVPAHMSGPVLDVLHALRDADKLDILRIMEEELCKEGSANRIVALHLADEPTACSPAVLEALEQGRSAKYSEMRYVNDFRLVLCSWLYDFHFAASLDIVRREGRYERILEGLDAVPEVQKRARTAVAQKLAYD